MLSPIRYIFPNKLNALGKVPRWFHFFEEGYVSKIMFTAAGKCISHCGYHLMLITQNWKGKERNTGSSSPGNREWHSVLLENRPAVVWKSTISSRSMQQGGRWSAERTFMTALRWGCAVESAFWPCLTSSAVSLHLPEDLRKARACQSYHINFLGTSSRYLKTILFWLEHLEHLVCASHRTYLKGIPSLHSSAASNCWV